MVSMSQMLKKFVTVYTLDHRGTGKSHYLTCRAAQALQKGSSGGNSILFEDMGDCLKDLNYQYQHHAEIFSVTNAAMDLKVILEHTVELDAPFHVNVFVYGYSYGTFLIQRLIQLEPKYVTGYILEGIDVPTDRYDPINSADSNWNSAIQEPTRRFLQDCVEDSTCPLKIGSTKTAVQELLRMYHYVDKDAGFRSSCLTKLMQYYNNEKASESIRQFVFDKVAHPSYRKHIPLVLKYLLQTDCDVNELNEFQHYLNLWRSPNENSTVDQVRDDNTLLYSVIVTSERWDRPSPSYQELLQSYRDGPFSAPFEYDLINFCIFTGAQDKVCEDPRIRDQLKNFTTFKPPPSFSYPLDVYFHKDIILPDTTSALLLGGQLDFQTPFYFAKYLYEKKLRGGRGRALIEFDYGAHCCGESIFSVEEAPCRDAIVTSFIQKRGDVSGLDTSCMKALPRLQFATDWSSDTKT